MLIGPAPDDCSLLGGTASNKKSFGRSPRDPPWVLSSRTTTGVTVPPRRVDTGEGEWMLATPHATGPLVLFSLPFP